MENNIFEVATKQKFRFEFRGLISVEDLWDLKLEQLDEIYKNLSAEIKKASEESLLNARTKDQEVIETKIEIIKHIVSVKLKDLEYKKQAIEKRKQKQQIMEILSEKENQDLKNKTYDELKAMLDNLD